MRVKFALLSLLFVTPAASAQEVVRRFQGSYTGSEQSVIAAPGVGKKLCLRSLVLTAEDAATDWRLLSKVGVAAGVAQLPNVDFTANSGAVLPTDEACWLILPENAALVVTTNNPIDAFGTYKILPK